MAVIQASKRLSLPLINLTDEVSRLQREHEIMRAALHSLLNRLEVGVECRPDGWPVDHGGVEIVERPDGSVILRRPRANDPQMRGVVDG